jgi:hypothetical protein
MSYESAIRELGSKVCGCGSMKSQGHAFCFFCWKLLTKELQKRLWEHFNSKGPKGYELTIEECKKRIAQASACVPDVRDESTLAD